MKVQFIYSAFERHAQAHPELLEAVPCDEYLGGPSLGIAYMAAVTPPGVEMAYCDDRVTPFSLDLEADLYALSFFTPAATRAMEIGDMLREAGRKVVAGGIFPTAMPEEASKHFDAVIVGEGEGVWPQVIADAAAGKLAPRYQATEPFDLQKLPPPRIDLYVSAENEWFHPDDYPLQTSRGCPLNCDACVVPCVMGKKLRLIPLESIERAVRDLARHGKRAAITEDTSFFFFSGARRHFRSFLHALEQDPRPRGQKVSYIGITMPMILALDPSILADISRAGINRFYLVCGFDPITRKAFGMGDAESFEKAVEAIKRCKDHDIEPYTSLMVGNDTDDLGVFDRTLEFTEKAGVPKTEFAIFTPYPATPAWDKMNSEGRIIDRSWKHYNDANVVFRPKQMTPEQLLEGYLRLWREFYKSKTYLDALDHGDKTIQF